MHRVLCALPSTVRRVHVAAAQALRSYSGGDGCSTPTEYVGAYTPVTTKLWQQRLALLQQPLEGVGDATAPRQPGITCVTYDFTTNATLRELYRNPWGSCRVGRLLEDIDSLSGSAALDHCRPSEPGAPPPLLVTASVDAIHYTRPITLTQDVEMTGQVVWTGRSSMDIRVQLTQGVGPPNLVATLCFVCLDPATMRGKPVPPLAPADSEERRAWFNERKAVADARKAAKLAQPAGSAAHRPPLPPAAQAELERLLHLGETKLDLPALLASPALLMDDTRTRNVFICQPQQRNLAGRVFGGFLMRFGVEPERIRIRRRRAYELAFATAYQFAGVRPAFVSVADITFRQPVDVGDLLRLSAFVVHTRSAVAAAGGDGDGEAAMVAVDVEARVVRPELLQTHISNTFTFEFRVARVRVPAVVPASEEQMGRLQQYLAEGSGPGNGGIAVAAVAARWSGDPSK